MCILAGCDYLKSFRNIGLKTAYKYVSQYPDLKQIISKLKRDIGKIPDDYEIQFMKAFNSFKYHRIFCPLTSEMKTLNPIPTELESSDLSFLGDFFDQDLMTGIARGRIHPFTKEPFNNFNLKRKISEIYQPIPKMIQVKKIKIKEEVKSIAQKIRMEKNTQRYSKYFSDTNENPCDEITEKKNQNDLELEKNSNEDGFKENDRSEYFIDRNDINNQFKPHFFKGIVTNKEKESEENEYEMINVTFNFWDNVKFLKVDLTSIFAEHNN